MRRSVVTDDARGGAPDDAREDERDDAHGERDEPRTDGSLIALAAHVRGACLHNTVSVSLTKH